jgi:hypothetical protein
LIAHGIEKEGLFGFGTVEGDLRKEKRAREAEEARMVGEDVEGGATGVVVAGDALGGNEELRQENEETGKKAKKWLGIW